MQRPVQLALAAALALALVVLAVFLARTLPEDGEHPLQSLDERAATAAPRAADLAAADGALAAPDAEQAELAGAPETARRASASAPAAAGPEAPTRVVRGRLRLPEGCGGAPEQAFAAAEVFALSRAASLAQLARLVDADAREALPQDERLALLDDDDDGAEDALALLARGPVDAEGRFELGLDDAASTAGRGAAGHGATSGTSLGAEDGASAGQPAEVHLLAVAGSAFTWITTPARPRPAAEDSEDASGVLDSAEKPAVELELACGAAVEGVVRARGDGSPGAPVAGVPVRLGSSMEDFMGVPTGERRIERHALTDARGAFRFAGLPCDTPYELDAVPDQGAAVRRRIARPAPGAVERVDITLPPGAAVTGLVRGEGGAPIAGATVAAALRGQWFGFDDRRVRATESAADGTFALEGLPAAADAGTVVLRASAPGHLASAAQTLELAPGERRADVVLELEPGASITGRLTWPDGAPAAGAAVTAAFDRAYLRDMRALEALRAPGAEATTGADGRFTIGGLAGGPYSLSARVARPVNASAAEDAAGAPVANDAPLWRARADGVSPGDAEVVLVLEPPLGIAGVVTSTGGAPVARFRASARELGREGPGAEGAAERHARAFEAETGAFFLDGLRAGSWELTVTAGGFAPSTPLDLALPRTAEEPVAIVLEPQAVVTGRVLSPLGGAVELPPGDAQVLVDEGQAAWVSAMEGRSGARARVEPDGTFRLEGLAPGHTSIYARARGFAKSESVALELVAGETQDGVALVLRTGGRLEGEVLTDAGEPDAGVSVRLTQMDTFEIEQTRADARGRFTAEHLVPGRWQVTTLPAGMSDAIAGGDMSAWIAKMKNAFVEIRDGETTTIVLGEPPADPVRVTGSVTHGGAPYDGALLTFLGEGTQDLAGAKIASVGADGRYAVTLDEPGDYLVYVQAITGNMGEQNTIEFRERVPTGPEHRFDVEIPTGRVSGRVETADGSPAADARVSLREAGGVASDSLWGGHYVEVRTDDAGRYDVQGLSPGRYTLSVGGMRLGGMLGADTPYARAVRHDLELREDEWLRDVDFELAAPGRLRVTVVDSAGAPVPGAAVFVRESSGALVDLFSLVTTSGGGAADYGGLAEGSYTASARKSGAASAESGRVKVRPGETSEVRLVLDEGAYALVSLRDAENAPLSGKVSVRDQDGREWAGMITFTDVGELLGEGGFSFDERRVGPLPPGRYDVEATVGDLTERRRVTLRAGDERRVLLRLR